MKAHQVRQRLGCQRKVVWEQVLEDGGEQSLHFCFRNKGDAVLEEHPTGANKFERLGEMNFVVVGAGGAEELNSEI